MHHVPLLCTLTLIQLSALGFNQDSLHENDLHPMMSWLFTQSTIGFSICSTLYVKPSNECNYGDWVPPSLYQSLTDWHIVMGLGLVA